MPVIAELCPLYNKEVILRSGILARRRIDRGCVAVLCWVHSSLAKVE